MPDYLAKNHPTINPAMVGFILLVYEIGFVLLTPVVAAYMKSIGRKNAIVIGFATNVVVIVFFGISAHIDPGHSFELFIVLCILRCAEGIGDTFVLNPMYAILTIEFPVNTQDYIGYVEAA